MVKNLNSLVAIDTEYNKNGELLSIGASNHEFKVDFFIKNKVDKKSYTFHGLAEDFLNENGLNKSEIKNLVNSLERKFNIFIGFDVLKDLQVLDFKNISKLYDNKRIIDIKCILDLYNKNRKLTLLAEDLGIDKNISSSLKHSSSYDSMITYLIFLKFFELEYDNNEDFFNIFIEDMTSLTNAFYYNQRFELDNYYSNFKKINDKLNKKDIKKEKKKELRYYIKNEFILFMDNAEKIHYRFPLKYAEEEKLLNFEKFVGNKEDIYGVKFYNEVVKKDCKQYSFT